MYHDTIAAIGTAMSHSGIGIVRISGEEAIAVADRIFRFKKKETSLFQAATHTIHYGYIVEEGQIIDEVLVSVMKGPHSYTAEDVVEINCHGGVLVMKRILETVLKHGARPAEAGEFTKRAFLNGRIDLSQAEAVIDLINSKNDFAMKSAVGQLSGRLSEKIRQLREHILFEIATIESALDDPEHITLDGYGEMLSRKLDSMLLDMNLLISNAENSRMLSEGIKTVILGKPNAGKSSLLNLLLGEDRAIVTEIAGTTRDTLEEQILLDGIGLKLIDTAGIRETEDVVEKIGVSKAVGQAENADLILSVGCRLDTSVTAFNDRNFGKCAKKVIVDIDANEIARMDMEKEAVAVCDAKQFLESLLKEIENDNDVITWQTSSAEKKDWLKYCNDIREAYPVVTEEHKKVKEYVSAYYFIGELCKLLREDDVIVPESSGGAGEITYQAFRLKEGQKMKNAAGLGSMGFGLPYAIGSCIANGRRRTVLINGDGAFQLNIQELETLHRLGLPVKIFIWNNDGYASIRSMQRNNFEGHYVASDETSGLTMPDISKVAAAYGFKTYRIRTNEELDKMLPEIMKDNEPMLCELMVLPEETVSPRVKAVVGENGKMISGPLEMMWPYVE